MSKIDSSGIIVYATPTIDTNIYASGDQLGSLVELSNALDNSSGTGVVTSVTVIDKAKQSSALQLLLFRDRPTITSVNNAALDISDSEMADKCIGVISVGSADYVALNVNSIATVKLQGLVVSSRKGPNNLTGTSLWVIARCGGTPTYTAVDDLVIAVGIAQD